MNKKNIKTICILSLVLCLLIPFTSTEYSYSFDYPTVSVGSISAVKGESIDVPITLTNNTGFINLAIEIDYDSDSLVLDSVNVNNLNSNTTYNEDYSVKPYSVSWTCTDNNTYNGQITVLHFTVLSDAVLGDKVISISHYKGQTGDYDDGIDCNFDEDYNSLNLHYSNGVIRVSQPDSVVTGYKFRNKNNDIITQIPNDVFYLDLSTYNCSVGSGQLFVAQYDSYYRFLGILSQDIEPGLSTAVFNIDNSSGRLKYIKAFLVESSNLKPIYADSLIVF